VPTLPTLTQQSPGIPSHRNKARRRKKRLQIGKETVKLSLFADFIILYLKDPKNSTQKLLDTIISLKNVAGIQNHLKKFSSLSIHQQ
jgi:hypothetical protein